MPEPLAHIYDLALRALDEQERRVAQLHARLTPVLAAGGVGVTLLAPPAVEAGHPILVAPSLVALGLSTLAATYLLLAGRLSFALDVSAAVAVARGHGLAPDDFHVAMAVQLDRLRRANLSAIERLQAAFTAMLCGMLVAVCGLGLAAAVA